MKRVVAFLIATIWCGNVYAANVSSWADLALTDSELVFAGPIAAASGKGTTITKSDLTQVINGDGNTLTGISDNNYYNDFFVVEGTNTDLTIQNLTVTGFKTPYSFLRALYDSPKLTIKDSIFENNSSVQGGGPIYFKNEGELVLNNVQFNNNTTSKYGGALWFGGKLNSKDTKATLTMVGGQFKENSSLSYGGAVFIDSSTNASFKDVLFEKNHSAYGGAIYAGADNYGIPDNTLNFDHVTFKDNYSENSQGGAVYAGNRYKIDIKNSLFIGNETKGRSDDGGAIKISDGSFMSIDNTQFIKNHTNMEGYAAGGAINLDTDTEMVLSNSLFDGNYSNEGGAFNVNNLYNVYNTQFLNNYASRELSGKDANGGAIYSALASKTNTILLSYFENNKADFGGALFLEGTDTDLIDTSFIGNKGKEGAAIYALEMNLNVFADTKDIVFSQNTASHDC